LTAPFDSALSPAMSAMIAESIGSAATVQDFGFQPEF
jgi:hypothetical protein